jgi:hypothetical protein
MWTELAERAAHTQGAISKLVARMGRKLPSAFATRT